METQVTTTTTVKAFNRNFSKSVAEGLLWSLLTVGLALIITFFIDVVIAIAAKEGMINWSEVAGVSFKADRLFSISIALLSALTVEQWFASKHSKNERTEFVIILCQLFVLFMMALFSSLHHFHVTEIEEYNSQLQTGLDLYHKNEELKNQTVDIKIPCEKQVKLVKQQAIDSETVSYWDDITVIISGKGEKVKCNCQKIATFALVITFLASVAIRIRMSLNRLQLN